MRPRDARGLTADWLDARRAELERRHPTWPARTLAAQLDAVADERPERPFVVDDDRIWTYRELQDRSARIARGLVAAGVRAGEDVAHAATFVAGALAATRAGAADVGAACVGFLSAVSFAVSLIEAGRARHVIGADALSRYLDPDDRGSAMPFGDGAGAVVLRADDGPSRFGPILLGTEPRADGLIPLTRAEPRIRMEGPEVHPRAVALMTQVAGDGRRRRAPAWRTWTSSSSTRPTPASCAPSGSAWGWIAERVVDDVGRYANPSAAVLPMALATAEAEGRLRPGMRVLLAAFDAGLVWGGAVVEWR